MALKIEAWRYRRFRNKVFLEAYRELIEDSSKSMKNAMVRGDSDSAIIIDEELIDRQISHFPSERMEMWMDYDKAHLVATLEQGIAQKLKERNYKVEHLTPKSKRLRVIRVVF